MPRNTRKKSKTGIYHVMLRGINRQDIFEDDEDYQKMYACLESLVYRWDEQGNRLPPLCTLYAYCMMSNHVHLLLREREGDISEVVKKIGVTYAYYFNRKYDRYGHLFQDRFRSEPVEDYPYFLTLLRYIHQNPEKAGLAKSVEDYRWSSCGEYFSNEPVTGSGICAVSSVCSRFDRNELQMFIRNPVEENSNILDIDTDRNERLSDEVLRSLLAERFGIEHPLDVQNQVKSRRNEIISYLKAEGGGIRQISRFTGVSLGLVQKI